MMNKILWRFAAVCALAAVAVWAIPAAAQMGEVKEKPPMYSYVGFWDIPRGQWAEMEKADAADLPVLQKAMNDGTIMAFGRDTNLVHSPDGATHDQWWASMSMAGLLNVLDQFYKNGSATSPVLESTKKHWDQIFVSRYYNYHPGSWKGAYTFVAMYKLKAEAPDNAVEMLSKSLLVPFFEKLLADGTVHEYEIDTEAIHSDSPSTFWIVYIGSGPDSIDKVNAALREAHRMGPLGIQAFGSMIDYSAHRDYLSRTDATYK